MTGCCPTCNLRLRSCIKDTYFLAPTIDHLIYTGLHNILGYFDDLEGVQDTFVRGSGKPEYQPKYLGKYGVRGVSYTIQRHGVLFDFLLFPFPTLPKISQEGDLPTAPALAPASLSSIDSRKADQMPVRC
jgi:hypothetical protein